MATVVHLFRCGACGFSKQIEIPRQWYWQLLLKEPKVYCDKCILQ